VDVHFVRDKVEKGVMKVVKIESCYQNANILTKSLVSSQHDFLCSRLGLVNPFSAKESNEKFEGGCSES